MGTRFLNGIDVGSSPASSATESQPVRVPASFAKRMVPKCMRIVFSALRHAGLAYWGACLASTQEAGVRFSWPAPTFLRSVRVNGEVPGPSNRMMRVRIPHAASHRYKTVAAVLRHLGIAQADVAGFISLHGHSET